MIKSFGRIDAIVKLHKWRFFISQFMMFIAALATVGYSTMITPLVNQGMVAGNTEVAIDIGINMMELAAVMGIAMAIATSQAVYFSQGAAYTVRRLYLRKSRPILLRILISCPLEI